MSETLFIIAAACVCWGIVSALKMASYISKRGHKINIFLFRIMIYRYINSYMEITREETGRTGRWFYHYVVAMNAALVLVIVGIILEH